MSICASGISSMISVDYATYTCQLWYHDILPFYWDKCHSRLEGSTQPLWPDFLLQPEVQPPPRTTTTTSTPEVEPTVGEAEPTSLSPEPTSTTMSPGDSDNTERVSWHVGAVLRRPTFSRVSMIKSDFYLFWNFVGISEALLWRCQPNFEPILNVQIIWNI